MSSRLPGLRSGARRLRRRGDRRRRPQPGLLARAPARRSRGDGDREPSRTRARGRPKHRYRRRRGARSSPSSTTTPVPSRTGSSGSHECFADPQRVGAGGALIPRWTETRPAWVPTEFYWVFGCSYTGLPEQLAPVRNPIGANMAVRRTRSRRSAAFAGRATEGQPREIRSRGVVRAQGNVPDDTDLAIRVKQRWPESIWLYQPEAKVHHTVTTRARLALLLPSPQLRGGRGKGSARRLRRIAGRAQLRAPLSRGRAAAWRRRGLRELLRRRRPRRPAGPGDRHRRDLERRRLRAREPRSRPRTGRRAGMRVIRAPTRSRRRPISCRCEWTTSSSARRCRHLPPGPAGGEPPSARRCAWFASTGSRSAWSRSTCPPTGSRPTRSRRGSRRRAGRGGGRSTSRDDGLPAERARRRRARRPEPPPCARPRATSSCAEAPARLGRASAPGIAPTRCGRRCARSWAAATQPSASR